MSKDRNNSTASSIARASATSSGESRLILTMLPLRRSAYPHARPYRLSIPPFARRNQAMRIAVVAALALVFATTGAAAPTGDFTNGQAVARAMERHYNSAAYKNRIAKSGARTSGRVLCAHDNLLERVECTGRLVLRGKQLRAKWELEKRTVRRARLSWTYKGPGVFDLDDEIVAPSAFGLTRF